MEWVLHDRLLRAAVLRAHVKLLEPLRIGTGRAITLTSPTDLPVLKMKIEGKVVPVIPGSSWKGVFRSTAYLLAPLRHLGHKPCTGLAGKGESALCFDREVEGMGKLSEFIDRIEQGEEPGGRELAAKIIMERACLLCKIFGSVSYASHVSFANSIPLGEFKIGYRTMVALDRRTGTVAHGKLFTPEYVEPGATFSFELRADNLPNYALGLLADIIEEIQAGRIRIGGFKSRGFGRISLTNITIDIYDFAVGGRPEELKALDKFDEDAKIRGEPWSKHEDAIQLLSNLREVWIKVAPKLPGPS